MAVYVYSTGSLPAAYIGTDTFTVTVINRTLAIQSFVIQLWNTTSGTAKTLLDSVSPTIGANQADVYTLLFSTGIVPTAIEIEFRFPNPHMAPVVSSATNTALTNAVPILAGEMFTDSDPNTNP